MVFSIRVHNGYAINKEAATDKTTCSQLLNSISNKLSDNRSLGSGYHIIDISEYLLNEEFDESYTVGGSINVTVAYGVNHTQE